MLGVHVVLCLLVSSKQCPDLTIANGQVTISRGLSSMTIYECDPGFSLVGDGNRFCQEDSSWSGEEPKCSKCFLCVLNQLQDLMGS